MRFLGFCVATLLVSCAYAQLWDDLRVRFGANPASNFIQMPRTVAAATAEGFRQETDCNGAKNKFLGRRFIHKSGDRSIMLLYDVNGVIAGIQTNVPKTLGYPTAEHKRANDVWIEEPTAHVLTAYFVNPDIICTTGRTVTQLTTQGTGNGLYVQKGSARNNNGVEFIQAPNKESQMGSTQWTQGKCFVFMGHHYWYNLRKDMPCTEFMPYFLLYNSGQLDGFGFAAAATFQGEFYEHPTVAVAGSFFPFTPDCMNDKKNFPQTLTTAHIYMHQRPWHRQCM